jgi:molecular chaperone DnaK (HSP70)
MKLVPYKIVNKDGKPYIQVRVKDGETKVFSPEEVSAMILTKMKETAEAFLGKTIRDAVVTVPGELANYNLFLMQFGYFLPHFVFILTFLVFF